MENQEIILTAVRSQAKVCKLSYDVVVSHGRNPDKSPAFQFERAKLMGMFDILDALKIDRKEFNWIFNC